MPVFIGIPLTGSAADVAAINSAIAGQTETANKLYKRSGDTRPFKEWIEGWKKVYDSKERKEPFLTFVENRINTGEKLNSALSVLSIIESTRQKLNPNYRPEQNRNDTGSIGTTAKKTTFLGMPPVLAVGIAVVVIGAAAFGIYKLVQSKKK